MFSQSILSLDLIEDFLRYKTEAADKKKSPRKVGVLWNCHLIVDDGEFFVCSHNVLDTFHINLILSKL